ncbi:MAG: flagellar hook-basal body complex protein FliE [Gammaproteobacteria bacterium]
MNTIDPNPLLLQMRALAARAQATPETTATATNADFRGMLLKAVAEVNQAQHAASALSDRFERGDAQVDLSAVMIATQKASVSFQAITQVRNKLIAAYQEVMNMPI